MANVHVQNVGDGYTVELEGGTNFPCQGGPRNSDYPGVAWFETEGAAFMFAIGVQAGLEAYGIGVDMTEDLEEPDDAAPGVDEAAAERRQLYGGAY